MVRSAKARTNRPKSAPAKQAAGRGSRWLAWLLLVAAVAAALGGGTMWLLAQNRRPDALSFRVVKAFAHDNRAYCQGLVFDDGFLYEGTGLRGQSTLRRVELESGQTKQVVTLDRRLFGEGITVMGDRIYQLTWQSEICIVYDKETLRKLGQFRYEGEGWGLTHDGTHLIMSDGSSALRFIDPRTFKEVRRVWVTSGGRAVPKLNELEYVEGQVLANLWKQDYIVRIDPRTGKINAWIDLRNLYPLRQRASREAVLNGIAYDAEGKRLFVTGKNWPKLYQIEIVPQP